MIHLSVYRSAAREALIVAAGVLLVLIALDVMWVHGIEIGNCAPGADGLCLRDLAGPPETDEESGALTSRGRSQQRTDYLWGTAFLLVGAGLAAVGSVSLLRRSPVAEVGTDGLNLRIAGPLRFTHIPWSNVTWVHSGSDGDDEAVPLRVFLVHVADPSPYPAAPWGATWDGATLMVDADSWNVPPEEVVAHATMALDTARREAEPGDELEALTEDAP